MNKELTTLARDMAISIVIFTLSVIGILGIPTWTKPEKHAGYFSVATNAWGTAIFQEKKYGQYQFTGFSDFTIDQNTIHMTAKKGSTGPFTFGRDDIIFDGQGIVYTEPKEEELLFLTKLGGKEFMKYESTERVIPIPSQFYLINPDIPGVLEYQFPTGALVTINREKKEMVTNTPIQSVLARAYDEMSK